MATMAEHLPHHHGTGTISLLGRAMRLELAFMYTRDPCMSIMLIMPG